MDRRLGWTGRQETPAPGSNERQQEAATAASVPMGDLSSTPEHVLVWAAMQRARTANDIDTAERLHQQWLDLLVPAFRADTNADSNTDSTTPMNPTATPQQQAPAPQQEEGEIDWENVNAEAQVMIDLNRGAMERWQAMNPSEPEE